MKGNPNFFVSFDIYGELESLRIIFFESDFFSEQSIPKIFVKSWYLDKTLYWQYLGNLILHPYFSSLLSIDVLFNPFSQSSQMNLEIFKLYIKTNKISNDILLMIILFLILNIQIISFKSNIINKFRKINIIKKTKLYIPWSWK